MISLPLKELYALFLESEWWVQLSRRKRAAVGKCERCPSRRRLQSHHLHYPDNWFDTTMEDLEVLCRSCHEKEHGIGVKHPKPRKVKKKRIVTFFEPQNWKDVNRLRSHRLITRKQYEGYRVKFHQPSHPKSPQSARTHRPPSPKAWWPGMYEGRTAQETYAKWGTAVGGAIGFTKLNHRGWDRFNDPNCR